ncbi:uncharacterized protein LOC118410847 [Branchiostoma floridae]|uniref:Uncharacterized protein LOC118410847 n=1 Tax=Branchiostoma floridae TaxID=7739 RepID=A0A9J7KRT8_BRAFL|nr:uncharacterized protein LOC118410847 [Branchiostoma floridae]
MNTFFIPAVLGVLICALGGWQALAGPVGTASPCNRGTYYNSATYSCEPCSLLCDQVRDSQEDCREKCPDWFDNKSEPYFIAACTVGAVAGVVLLTAIILGVALVLTRRELSKYKKMDQEQKMGDRDEQEQECKLEQQDVPKARRSPKDLTPDLQMKEMPNDRPHSPIAQVTDETPLCPSDMRSIHANETTKSPLTASGTNPAGTTEPKSEQGG